MASKKDKGSEKKADRRTSQRPKAERGQWDGQPLLIVESPAKARTIRSLLGRSVTVESTMGHIMDLPEKRFGVEIEKGFEPEYVLRPKRETIVERLKEVARRAREVYLASDPDREGEAIAWHIQKLVGRDDAKRIELHEITRPALEKALHSPRTVDMNLVEAQQARRVLDRIFGYSLSPLLWKKIRSKLSAGRVQSVALRLLVEREREIQSFVPQEYWTLIAVLTPEEKDKPFEAQLTHIGDTKVVSPEKPEKEERDEEKENATPSIGRSKGGAKSPQREIIIGSEAEIAALIAHLKDASYRVIKVERGVRRRTPPPPFITSTLQQEASKRLGFNPSRTMRLAQELYEGVDIGSEGRVGLITYMRTDSPRVSLVAQQEARDYITSQFGPSFVPPTPRQYRAKRLAQEAHEAIRPTSLTRPPELLAPYLTKEQLSLYRLIWNSFLASQMADAVYDTLTVTVKADAPEPAKEGPGWLLGVQTYQFRASGRRLRFLGWLKVMSAEGEERDEEGTEFRIPELSEGEPLNLLELRPQQSFTRPPARYTQATLVRALEELGIGRPSTYAPTVDTLLQRGYARQDGKSLVPTPLGTLVCDRLVAFFPDLISVDFTAKMEEELDEVEEGRKEWREVVTHFYDPFRRALETAQAQMEREKNRVTNRFCPLCGSPMVLRHSAYGPFLSCSAYPRCKGALPVEESETRTCPNCGGVMVKRNSGGFAYYRCLRYPECPGLEPLEGTQLVRCPQCGSGFLLPRLVRRGKRKGRIFYSCSIYPSCRFALWNKPLADNCPQCGFLLVEKINRRGEKQIVCINPDCSYAAPVVTGETGEERRVTEKVATLPDSPSRE